MSHIPVPYTPIIRPANTKTVIALQDGARLVIYIEAYIHTGSRLLVQRVKVENFVPMFRVSEVFRERPGPHHPVDLIFLQKEAFTFEIETTRLIAITANGPDEVQVVPVQPDIHSFEGRAREPEVGWIAIHDSMPIGKPRLIVSGTVETPSPGWALYLKKIVPVDKPDPKVYYLELVRIPPAENIKLPTPNLVVYQVTTEVHFKIVRIRDEEKSIDVKVQEVS